MTNKRGKRSQPPQPPPRPLSEVELYSMLRRSRGLDPNNPAVQHLMRFASEIWERYIQTATMEDIVAMKAENERRRAQREMMFGNRIRPVIPWETQRRWIEQYGLSVVLEYELDDPC